MTDNKQLEMFDLPRLDRYTVRLKPIKNPIWTENKAKLIQRYLYYFVLLTKHGIYIDGFAGPQDPEKPDSWAAKLVVESKPRWLRKLFLCDEHQLQVKRLEKLVSDQPPRQAGEPKRLITVIHDNFNAAASQILQSGAIRDTEATFCLLDQRTTECEWATVESIARHKEARGNKIEIFYFLPIKWLSRSLTATRDKKTIEKWWGRSDWNIIAKAKNKDRSDLMCQRFYDLGYKSALAWPIYQRRGGGAIMYYMVHATDHLEAPNLMSRAYDKALSVAEKPEQFELAYTEWKTAGS